MGTVSKALSILDLFSETRPSVGLSEAARFLSKDKATILRYLNALESKGFIEQDPFTRSYHLGPALARLALIRNITYPVNRAAKNILKKLVSETGETAHLSHFSSGVLTHIAIEETSFRGTRVYVDPAEPLTLHATASGIAYLSQCSDQRREELLKGKLSKHTDATSTDLAQIMSITNEARENGFASARGTFESDVHGIAAPVFGPSGEVCGAVSVATPVSRMNDKVAANIVKHVKIAAEQISRHFGADHQREAAAE